MSQRNLEMELDIANILKGIAFWEISMENFRIRLAENPSFDPELCFNRLDRTEDDKVEVAEMQAFLSVHRIAATDPECEYLINMKSEIQGIMNKDRTPPALSFFDTVLPMTEEKLKNESKNRRREWNRTNTYQKHFLSADQVLDFSEKEVAKFFGEEIMYLREIESLRKQFSSEYGRSVYEIFRIVDYKERGFIDYEVLSNFLRKHKISFSKSEFEGLLRRISRNFDDKIDYQELVNAIVPREPFNYPAFRADFNPNIESHKKKKMEEFESHIKKKMEEFGCPLYILEEAKKEVPRLKNQTAINTSKDPYYSFRKVFDPFRKGRNQYIYDQDYMKQFNHYKNNYVLPNKVEGYKYAESSSGLRYHDHFFDNYYQYLYERDKGEEFFNRYGKRYVQDYDASSSDSTRLTTSESNYNLRQEYNEFEGEEEEGLKPTKRFGGEENGEKTTRPEGGRIKQFKT